MEPNLTIVTKKMLFFKKYFTIYQSFYTIFFYGTCNGFCHLPTSNMIIQKVSINTTVNDHYVFHFSSTQLKAFIIAVTFHFFNFITLKFYKITCFFTKTICINRESFIFIQILLLLMYT